MTLTDAPARPDTGPHHGERHDPHCLAPEALTRLLEGAPWRRVAFVGDSIAAGVGDPVDGYLDAPWADRLVHALRAAVGPIEHLNLGVPGMLAAEIRSGQLERAVRFGPDLAVVSAGPNDMLRRRFEPAAVEAELDGIVAPLASRGCLVVTFGLFDLSRTPFVPDGMRADLRDRLVRLNTTTRAVSRRHGGVHVDFFDHPAVDEAIFSADMIHPNRRGHACIATEIVRSLAPAVTDPARRTGSTGSTGSTGADA